MPLARLAERTFAALGIVLGAVMGIERDAQNHPGAEAGMQGFQTCLDTWAHHRAHGIGQQQQAMATLQDGFHDRQDVRAHERFAARNAYLLGAFPKRIDLVEEGRHVRQLQVDEAVIGWRTQDVAVRALDIAERTGIQP